jgi:hypothetical protein
MNAHGALNQEVMSAAMPRGLSAMTPACIAIVQYCGQDDASVGSDA